MSPEGIEVAIDVKKSATNALLFRIALQIIFIIGLLWCVYVALAVVM